MRKKRIACAAALLLSAAGITYVQAGDITSGTQGALFSDGGAAGGETVVKLQEPDNVPVNTETVENTEVPGNTETPGSAEVPGNTQTPEDTAVQDPAETAPQTPNTVAVFQDENIAVYTAGYPVTETDPAGSGAENYCRLHLRITLDGQPYLEQTLLYTGNPGRTEAQVNERYGTDGILLDGVPFENGGEIIFENGAVTSPEAAGGEFTAAGTPEGEAVEEIPAKQLEISLYTKAQLTVHYQDNEGNALAEDTVINGRLGETVSWENPVIEGYEVSEDAATQSVLEAPAGEMTVVYHVPEIVVEEESLAVEEPEVSVEDLEEAETEALEPEEEPEDSDEDDFSDGKEEETDVGPVYMEINLVYVG